MSLKQVPKDSSRRPRRFFTAQSLSASVKDLWLDPAETHHLKKSIRLQKGDLCLITDGQGLEAEARILDSGATGRAHLEISKILEKKQVRIPGLTLRILPALLKKGKTDFIIEKAQELGVSEIWPVVSEHCDIRIAKDKEENVRKRWERITIEASKQSGSLHKLCLGALKTFNEAILSIPKNERIAIFHPGAEAVPFSEWIEDIQRSRTRIKGLNLFFGPEGGFSDQEITWAREQRGNNDFQIVSLGQNILKADTAFLGVTAALKFILK